MAKNKKNTSKVTSNPEISEQLLPKEFKINNQTVLAILAILVGFAYMKIWQNGIVWDDNQYIFKNDVVKNFDWKGIFSTYQMGNYHPITMLSLAIDYAVAHEQTWIYHFENLLFHILNSFLIFRLLKRLNQTDLVALMVVVLFAIHPLHVESVAWKAERKDVLFTFFLLISFLQYLSFDKTKSTKYYIFSIICFVLACLSKGMAVVLPALLIITDYVFLEKKINAKMFLNKIPYFIFTIIFSIISIKAQQQFDAVAGFLTNYYTFFDRILLATYSFCFYWVKSILPINLIPFYPYPNKPLPYYYYFSLIVVLGITYLIFKYGKKNKEIVWGVLFYLISISTVLQILPVGSAITADRYSYLSSIGIFYTIAFIINQLWNKYLVIKWLTWSIFLIFFFTTIYQVSTWKDTLTLFGKALKLNPKDAITNYNIAYHYFGVNDKESAVKYFKAAENNGLLHAPTFRTVAEIYIDLAKYDEAIQTVEKIKKQSRLTNYDNWLYGTAYYRKKDFQNASNYFKIASENEPAKLNYQIDYGKALTDAKKIPDAIAVFQKLYDSGKKDAEIYQLLGNCYIKTPEWQKGIEYWKKGAELLDDGQFEFNIGIQYAIHGDLESTREYYKKAARKGNQGAIVILNKNGDSF